MKNIVKLFSILLILIIFSAFFTNVNVEAADIEEILSTDRKIVKYDATTGETTEVDINELRKKIRINDENEMWDIEPFEPFISKVFGYKDGRILNSPRNILDRRVGKTSCSEGVSGTGVLVARNLVLTAAHCVYNTETATREKLTNWMFQAGFDEGPLWVDNDTVELASGWKAVYYEPEWKKLSGDAAMDYDWALCELYTPLGDWVGAYGAKFPSNDFIMGRDVSAIRISWVF